MNTIFKQGDRVELIEDYKAANASKGTQGSVTRDELKVGNSTLVEVSFDNGYIGSSYTNRLKLVEQEFKAGDRVQITIPEGERSSWGGNVVVSGLATIIQHHSSDSDKILVVADTPHPNWRVNQAWIYKAFITPLMEETEAAVAVGDTIEALKDVWSRVPKETRLIVTTVHTQGAVSARVEDSADLYPWFLNKSQFKRVPATPAPKTEKKKATLVDNDNKPQIGDTIVAFWENNGVEYRQKGVVARIESDGTLATAENNHINVASNSHSYSYSGFAPHVYIVERAPKPEPVKVDPNQKWIDAPIGSIARDADNNFVWRKTDNNEWSLLTRDGSILRDRNDSTVGMSAVLFTF